MSDKMKGLKESDKKRTAEAKARVIDTIHHLAAVGEKVNFNNVQKTSGISKSFLYKDNDIRALIEEHRACIVDNEMNQRAKYDKTSHSKNVIIVAKDKRIAKLEEENRKFRKELEYLRGLLYEQK